jgi:hypothetical protein
MSATPETDALWREMTTGNSQPSWWVAAERMRDHAKRLERERDEARTERDKLQVMRKEVVAANKGAKINAQVSNSLAGKLNRAERERDEARAVAYDLAVIASHCLGSHGSALLTETSKRIADTLKRWRELKE